MRQPSVHGHVRVWSLPTGPLQENAVLVAGAQGEGFLFDPGDDAERILALIRDSGVTVRGILLTHAHFDHIGAVQPVREALRVPVWLHPADLPLYSMGAASAGRWNLPFIQPEAPDHSIAQDQTFTAGDLTLTARELPGHAPGHVVFLAETDGENGVVVAGDTLFQGSIGRTDLPGGDSAAMVRSLLTRVLPLPDATDVLPGHGPATTIGRERATNPHLLQLARSTAPGTES